MASMQILVSPLTDFVNGSTPRTINVYTVPTGFTLVLYSIDVVTINITSSGNDPVMTIGNTSDHAAYEQTHLENTYDYIPSAPPARQTVAGDTTITATITTNSTATAHRGVINLVGYLIPMAPYALINGANVG